jgi:predicted Zn-dependent peptidase
MLDFYRLAWRPEKATLIVTGAAPYSILFETVARSFEAWRAGEGDERPADRQDDRPPAGRPGRIAIVDRPGSAQSELRVGRVGARRASPDYHALLVLNLVLGGQFTSRINMNLREDKGLTYGARSSFDFRRRPGPFTVQTSVQTDGSAAALAEIFSELEAIRHTRPATEEELVRARAGLTGGYAKQFETAGQIARAALQLALYELPDDELVTFIDRVKSIDAAAVADAASIYCDARDFSTMVVGDYARIREAFEPLGLGEPTLYPSADPFF